MLAVLLESKARPVRRRGGAALSVVAHTAVILGAVAATGVSKTVVTPPAPPLIIPLQLPPQPGSEPAPPPPGPRVPASPIGPVIPGPSFRFERTIHDVLPPLDSMLTSGASVDPRTFVATGDSLIHSHGVGLPHAGPYLPNQVERLASIIRPATPTYPEMLRRAGVPGHVLVRSVVDTNGAVEPSSVEVRESTHPAFEQAVRAVLPKLRFAPAEVGGRRVRLLVELPFDFALDGR